MDALRPGSGVAPMVRVTPRDQILKAVIRYRRCRHLTSVAYPRTGGREISPSGGSSTWNTEVVQGNGGQINDPFFVPSSNMVRLCLGLFLDEGRRCFWNYGETWTRLGVLELSIFIPGH